MCNGHVHILGHIDIRLVSVWFCVAVYRLRVTDPDNLKKKETELHIYLCDQIFVSYIADKLL